MFVRTRQPRTGGWLYAVVAALWLISSSARSDDNANILSMTELPNIEPSIDEKEGTIFCTFDSFSNPGKLERLPIHINWPISLDQIPPQPPRVAIQFGVPQDSGPPRTYLYSGPLKRGRQIFDLKLTPILSQISTPITGFKKIPFSAATWIKGVEPIAKRPISPSDRNLFICSFGDLNDQSYRITMNEISDKLPTKARWFKWNKPNAKNKFTLNVSSVDEVKKLRTMLTTTATFGIEKAPLELRARGAYFIKQGSIIASLRGTTINRKSIDTIANWIEAENVFIGEGKSYQQLEASFADKSTQVDKALREHEEIYLLNQGRLILVKADEIKENAGLIRAYLSTATGLFVQEPKLVK